jgi:RNA polymerase-binding transcription factor DksA
MKLNGLIENDQQQVKALEAALLRIENRTYGICTETGEYIRRERLEAMPEATTCLKPVS